MKFYFILIVVYLVAEEENTVEDSRIQESIADATQVSRKRGPLNKVLAVTPATMLKPL